MSFYLSLDNAYILLASTVFLERVSDILLEVLSGSYKLSLVEKYILLKSLLHDRKRGLVPNVNLYGQKAPTGEGWGWQLSKTCEYLKTHRF